MQLAKHATVPRSSRRGGALGRAGGQQPGARAHLVHVPHDVTALAGVVVQLGVLVVGGVAVQRLVDIILLY